MNRDETWLLKEKYNGVHTADFFADCERLKTGEPLAYIIGHIPFLNSTIYLDSKPLIPRPETEYWINRVIVDIQSNPIPHFRGPTPKMGNSVLRILDLCAGSGCIGVAVLKKLKNAIVDFAEIETKHHATIQKNIELNGIDPTRTHIYGGDCFESITETYDFILTNPPYIDASQGRTETSVLDYEPHTALFADDSGFAIIEKIICNAPSYLTSTGTLVIEHEPEHTTRVIDCARKSGLATTTERDQYGIERYTLLTRMNTEIVAP